LQSDVDPARVVFSGPPSIWEGAFRTWRKLAGGPSPTLKGEALTSNQWLGQPLFYNPFLHANDAASFGFAESWSSVATVGDLVDRPALALSPSSEHGIPTVVARAWWQAIPESARARLRLFDVDFAS